MKKAILYMMLAAMAAAMLLPVSAVEADAPRGTCGDELAWILEGNTLTISGYGEMYDYVSGAPWDSYRDEIEKVVFEGEVSYVGAYAFEDYDGITQVEFGDSMKTLGIRSFAGCDGLTRIHLPAAFKVFAQECLLNCKNLKAIHCEGTFPSFKLNCLWQTETKIYYPANRPWPVSLVQELEEAFSGRIEFLDSNGNDPYTPETDTTAPETTVPETTAPETTVPETTAPETTAPVTVPETTVPETTVPQTTAPATETTKPEETAAPPPVWTTVAPTEAPEHHGSGGRIGLAIVVLVLSLLGLGTLIFNRGKKRRYR